MDECMNRYIVKDEWMYIWMLEHLMNPPAPLLPFPLQVYEALLDFI